MMCKAAMRKSRMLLLTVASYRIGSRTLAQGRTSDKQKIRSPECRAGRVHTVQNSFGRMHATGRRETRGRHSVREIDSKSQLVSRPRQSRKTGTKTGRRTRKIEMRQRSHSTRGCAGTTAPVDQSCPPGLGVQRTVPVLTWYPSAVSRTCLGLLPAATGVLYMLAMSAHVLQEEMLRFLVLAGCLPRTMDCPVPQQTPVPARRARFGGRH